MQAHTQCLQKIVKSSQPKQRESLTGICERCVAVSRDIPFSELEHVTIDLLGLSGKTESLEERPKRGDERHIAQVHRVDKGVHDRDVLLVAGATFSIMGDCTKTTQNSPLAEVLADRCLVKAVGLEQETCYVFRLPAGNKASFDEEFDALRRGMSIASFKIRGGTIHAWA